MNLKLSCDNDKKKLVEKLIDFIKIKSVEEDPKENMPFGEGVHRALEYALTLSEEIGLETKNLNNMAGYADLGQGHEMLGILAHVDVVPEGEGWTYPPYDGEIHDGKIYGRGTIDDKGPAIAVLFALQLLKDNDVKLSKKVRLIFGTNEETSWKGIDYYLDHEQKPDFGFTPDADFPVIQGEKGILELEVTKEVDSQENYAIKTISAGIASNVVPCKCEIVLDLKKVDLENLKKNAEILESKYKTKINITEFGEECQILIKGISAHASTPEAGFNAISLGMKLLNQLNLSIGDGFIEEYNNIIGMNFNGENIGCSFKDELSGKLTFNVGVLKYDGANLTMVIDIRYPVTIDGEKVIRGIENVTGNYNWIVKEITHMKPISIPANHPMIKSMLKVYRDITDDDKAKPIFIGGGTYARASENIVAFGPCFPGQEDVAHQVNEYIEIDHLVKLVEIYAKTIYELAK